MTTPVLIVKTEQFTGPVKLLVCLVQQHKSTVANVNLPAVVCQYAQYVHDCLAGDYQLTSFTSELPLLGWLIERRSCRLLPVAPLPISPVDQDYEAKIKQILDYRRFQVLARSLKTAHTLGQQLLGTVNPFSVQPPPSNLSLFSSSLSLNDEQFWEAWRDIAEKIRYADIKDFNVVKMRWSPAQIKTKMLSFLQHHPRRQWSLLSFLLNFAFDLSTLLCAFLLVLELIYHDQLALVRVAAEWMVKSIN